MIPSVPGARVDVPDIPYRERVELPSLSSVVIVVDMQNDFVHDDGSLRVPGAGSTLVPLADLLERARRAGVRVAYTQDTHEAGDPEWEIWPEHCRRGSWGWRIVPELQPHEADPVFEKARYDGFYGTSLEHVLSRVWRVEHTVIVGTVANICVAQTAASAGLRWFHVVMPADGISALSEFDQALALRQTSMLYAGDVLERATGIHFV